MFGIGTPELVLIIVLLALILGPRNLPRAARKAGEIKRELDRARGSLTSALDLRGWLDPTREPPPPPPRTERRSSDRSSDEGGDTG
jgi:Sec-independent protein translocase protein TatA